MPKGATLPTAPPAVTAGREDVLRLPEEDASAAAGLAALIRHLPDTQELSIFRRVLEASSEAVLVTAAAPLDEPGPRIVYANPALERQTGYSAEELFGRTPRLLQGADTSPRARRAIRLALAAGRPVRQEILNFRRDGTPYWVALHIAPVLDANGARTHFVSVQRDITAQKREAQRLADSEAGFRGLFDHHPMPLWIYDRETLAVVKVNRTAEAAYGWSRGQFLAMSALDMFAPDDRPAVGRIAETRETGFCEHGPWRLIAASGEMRHVHVRSHTLTHRGRPCALAAIWDVTERVVADAERQALLRRLVESLEQERLRIARELHDQMGQDLTALSLGLARLEALVAPGEVAHALRPLQELVTEIGRNVHRVSRDLRPMAIDDIGVDAAIEAYVAEWTRRSLIPVDFQAAGVETADLPDDIRITLFRAVQETLTNVARHAGARGVSVALTRGEHGLRLVVEDDGRGIAEIAGAPPRLGLTGLRERMALVGGSMEIESAPGAGTRVYMTIPLARPASAPARPGSAPGRPAPRRHAGEH